MQVKNTPVLLRAAALCAALLLALLRVFHLKTAFDENGLLPPGSPALLLTVLSAVCCFALLCFLCLRLNRLPGREDCFSRGAAGLFFRLTAAILVFFGAGMALLERPEKAETLIACVGLLSGLLLVWTALAPRRDRGFFWARLVPALYAGATLVLQFRDWSHDPMVIHVAPILLAWTACMVEMMLLSGFSLGAGHRRSAVLFGLCAGVFTCMTLPDYLLGLRSGVPDLLTLLGLALWGAVSALELLRPAVQTETMPEPAPEPAPETAAEAPAEEN